MLVDWQNIGICGLTYVLFDVYLEIKNARVERDSIYLFIYLFICLCVFFYALRKTRQKCRNSFNNTKLLQIVIYYIWMCMCILVCIYVYVRLRVHVLVSMCACAWEHVWACTHVSVCSCTLLRVFGSAQQYSSSGLTYAIKYSINKYLLREY